jgi:hypothetical protein
MTISFAKVMWFNAIKGHGVAALLTNGLTIGIHRDSGRMFYRGTETPELRLVGRRLNGDPKKDDPICLVRAVRKSRAGNPYAEVWGTTADYEAAGHEIHERYRALHAYELDHTRIEASIRRAAENMRLLSDPKFQLVEEEYQFGKRTTKPTLVMFTGTKEEFRARQNSRHQHPLVTGDGKVGAYGHQYRRRFRREVSSGWIDSENPLYIELPTLVNPPWGFEEAVFALNGAKVKRAPWTMTGIGFRWFIGNNEVARGNCEELQMLATDTHSETILAAGQAEYLWEQADKADIDVVPNRERPLVQGLFGTRW